MRFGLHLPNFGPVGDPKTLASLAAEAESAGWNGFFLWDHILGDPQWREPMVDPGSRSRRWRPRPAGSGSVLWSPPFRAGARGSWHVRRRRSTLCLTAG